jgi:hypothetical protein
MRTQLGKGKKILFRMIFLTLLMSLLGFSCADLQLKGKEIYSFSFKPEFNDGLDKVYSGKIRGPLIELTLPPGTNANSLVPSFEFLGAAVLLDNQPLFSGGSQ